MRRRRERLVNELCQSWDAGRRNGDGRRCETHGERIWVLHKATDNLVNCQHALRW